MTPWCFLHCHTAITQKWELLFYTLQQQVALTSDDDVCCVRGTKNSNDKDVMSSGGKKHRYYSFLWWFPCFRSLLKAFSKFFFLHLDVIMSRKEGKKRGKEKNNKQIKNNCSHGDVQCSTCCKAAQHKWISFLSQDTQAFQMYLTTECTRP